jgi:glycosyltransferase involved in cell wall biosynthesis
MPQVSLISVILATYNWPEALGLCLQALEAQTDRNFEIVIADDGSRDETKAVIQAFVATTGIPIRHEWQPDDGFRKSQILNKAIASSQGQYLVFLDGDCLVQPDFIERHRAMSQSEVMVTGSRILLNQSLTQHYCGLGVWSYAEFSRKLWAMRLSGQINKILPLWVKLPDSSVRMYADFVWRRIKGCNMAAWREDVLRIGGFDETMQGWGHEDADFVFRLHKAGIGRKSGAWATEVLHLWHPAQSKENAEKNAQIVRARILAKG